MNYPIIVSEIKISAKTAAITKCTSFEQVIQSKDSLFSELSEPKLVELINEIYGGKLKASDLEVIKEMSKEEKRNHALSVLTFQLPLTQEAPRKVNEQDTVNNVGFFLKNRLNVSNQTSLKYFWQTIDLATIEEFGYTKGSNFSEIMKNKGFFTYVFRQSTFNPEVNGANLITSSPKRAGKGGDILTKEGKLIFTKTDLIMQKFDSVEEFDEMNNKLYQAELKNTEEFKHDGTIDSVTNSVPLEVKQKDGTFNPEFQTWLNERVSVGMGAQVEIAA